MTEQKKKTRAPKALTAPQIIEQIKRQPLSEVINIAKACNNTINERKHDLEAELKLIEGAVK